MTNTSATSSWPSCLPWPSYEVMLAKVSLASRLQRVLALCGVSAIIMSCVFSALPKQPQRVTALPTADQNVSIATVENYIAVHHSPALTWHVTMNNTCSTRPRRYGGSTVYSVTDCKMFNQARDGTWICCLVLPNSFTPDDNLQVVGEGQTYQRRRRMKRRAAMPWRNS